MIKVIIGAADINFELWFQGQKLSADNPIVVEWQSTSAPPVRPEEVEDSALSAPAVSRSRGVGEKHFMKSTTAMLSNVSLPMRRKQVPYALV
jgi:hypothetical protein